ncbi:hypothetical protein CPC08DRAFT_722211 [Agrocybe pediades]|nr:hypothetical protein CPC08DRAFT_722211 [Agrocybe pediades]
MSGGANLCERRYTAPSILGRVGGVAGKAETPRRTNRMKQLRTFVLSSRFGGKEEARPTILVNCAKAYDKCKLDFRQASRSYSCWVPAFQDRQKRARLLETRRRASRYGAYVNPIRGDVTRDLSCFSTNCSSSTTMLKRVHFAPTNTVYEPGSASPSPSLTTSSLPSESSSSPDLLTPPPDDYHQYHPVYPPTPHSKSLDLYAEPPLLFSEPVLPERNQIHCMLAYSPYTNAPVHYDLSLPPDTVEGHFPLYAFSESATSPPVQSLRIRHPNVKFEWEVTATPPVGGGFVTVEDVFEQLYRELRLPILPMEYAEIPEGPVKASVDAAYYQRCARIADMEERQYEMMKGIKRIDLLMGRTQFMGLSGVAGHADLWELNVS